MTFSFLCFFILIFIANSLLEIAKLDNFQSYIAQIYQSNSTSITPNMDTYFVVHFEVALLEKPLVIAGINIYKMNDQFFV